MAATRLTHDERRAAILDTAVKLFSAKGFRGTTTRELASAVGVSEPVLYQHFATKGDLYKAILEERAVADDRNIPCDLEAGYAGVTDDREFLVRLANAIIDWHVSEPTYIRLLMFSTLEGHELADLFYERYSKGFFAALRKFFEKRVAEGSFRQLDPKLATHTFIALAANYGQGQALFKHDLIDLPQADVVRGLVDIFLGGIRKHDK